MSDSEPEDTPEPEVPPPVQPAKVRAPRRRSSTRSRESYIKEALTREGFKDSVIPFVCKPQRDTSCNVYDSHWDRFMAFCEAKNWDPRLTNAQRMCEYLVHLYEDGKAVNTIECTHAALRSVLHHFGYPEVMPKPVKDCIASLWKERPRERKICTQWNINYVLDSLLKPPYVDEDGDDTGISLRHMTIKTAFLTALACSRRKSELHAFSRAKGLFRAESSASGEVTLTIHTSPGFVAKNQKGKELYPEVVLSSIFHEFPDTPEEALLCPVRSIRRYMDRTKDWPNPKSLLFVNPDRSKNTTAASLASWLKAAITEAYSQVIDSPHCTPHEVRAVSTSLSIFNHASVSEILAAGTWKNFSTFTENYLRDVAPGDDNDSSYKLPSFIAAGNRIPSSK